MLSARRTSDLVAAALEIIPQELKRPILRELARHYGPDFIAHGVFPHLPEYATRNVKNWTETEILRCDDVAIWLRLLTRNWKTCFGPSRDPGLEKTVETLNRLRNQWAHSPDITGSDAAFALAAVRQILQSFSQTIPAELDLLAAECRLRGYRDGEQILPSVTSNSSQLSVMDTPMANSTLRSNPSERFVIRRKRQFADLFRSASCPAQEAWMFHNPRTGEYVVRRDSKPKPWPDCWNLPQLARVQLGTQELQIKVTTQYLADRKVRSVGVTADLEIRVLSEDEAIRRIGFQTEDELDRFIRLAEKSMIADLTERYLRAGCFHGSYSAVDLAAFARDQTFVGHGVFEVVRFIAVSFGDPTYAVHLQQLDAIDRGTEIAIGRLQADESVFRAAEPFVDAQRKRALDEQLHQSSREAIASYTTEIPYRLKQETVVAAFRQLKSLGLTEQEKLLFAAQLDPESVRVFLEFQRLDAQEQQKRMDQIFGYAERMLKAMRQRSHYR